MVRKRNVKITLLEEDVIAKAAKTFRSKVCVSTVIKVMLSNIGENNSTH